MIPPDLPAELKVALDRKAQGLSRTEAAGRAAAISKTYRGGGGSGAIRSEAPSHVVIFDAAEIGAASGTFTIINPEQIAGTSFSTHMLPLQILTDYLVKATGCRIVIVGIQPKLLEFAYDATPEVIKAADCFVAEFCQVLAG